MVATDNLAFIQEVNDAFARNDLAFLEANLADDIKWTMVGSPSIEGKAAVTNEFRNMGDGPGPELTIANIVDGGSSVAVEGTMTMVDDSGTTLEYAFCDVYGLNEQGGGRIASITAYLVKLEEGATS